MLWPIIAVIAIVAALTWVAAGILAAVLWVRRHPGAVTRVWRWITRDVRSYG